MIATWTLASSSAVLAAGAVKETPFAVYVDVMIGTPSVIFQFEGYRIENRFCWSLYALPSLVVERGSVEDFEEEKEEEVFARVGATIAGFAEGTELREEEETTAGLGMVTGAAAGMLLGISRCTIELELDGGGA